MWLICIVATEQLGYIKELAKDECSKKGTLSQSSKGSDTFTCKKCAIALIIWVKNAVHIFGSEDTCVNHKKLSHHGHHK